MYRLSSNQAWYSTKGGSVARQRTEEPVIQCTEHDCEGVLQEVQPNLLGCGRCGNSMTIAGLIRRTGWHVPIVWPPVKIEQAA